MAQVHPGLGTTGLGGGMLHQYFLQGGVGVWEPRPPENHEEKRTSKSGFLLGHVVRLWGVPRCMCSPVPIIVSQIYLPSTGGVELQGFQIPREPGFL